MAARAQPTAQSLPPSDQTRSRALEHRIARGERLLARAERISLRFSRWRMAIFLAGLAATIIPYRLEWYNLGNTHLALFVLIFGIVARYHSKLEAGMHRLRLWLGIKRTNLARLRLDWAGIPQRPQDQAESPDGRTREDHPYAKDLDLIGHHALLRLLDTTLSTHGHARLTAWLLDQHSSRPDPEVWHGRQILVRELSRLTTFRDRLALEARLVGQAEIDGRRIQAALDSPAGSPRLVPLLVVQSLLVVTTISLGLATILTGFPGYWVLSFAAYVAIFLVTLGHTSNSFSQALALHHEFEKLGAVFRYLERRSYGPFPALGRLCTSLIGGRHRPSAYVARLARVAHALSIRANPLIHMTANALCPWDLWFTHRLARLQVQVQADLPSWLDRLAEIEAAGALAAFADRHPGYAWPTLLESERDSAVTGNGRPAAVVARGLGHPLIPAAQRITNDLELRGLGRVLLMTGSNMSGKSTFLRTVGINVCLAQAGGPVCAEAFEWSWCRPYCCIRVDDSLDAGLSYFYAEVKRLKRLLDAMGDGGARPVLFLIDEIFKGTNNRERLIGSKAYIRALAGGTGLGLITTHDLELAELEKEIPGLTNAHFRETVEANLLRFDYRLRPGPCPTTNALRIMAMEGLPVPDRRE